MGDYLADKLDLSRYSTASRLLDQAITTAFAQKSVRPMEFGGDMGTKSVTNAIAETCKSLTPDL